MNFPAEPGCYIEGNHGHYAMAELLMRYGNDEDKVRAADYNVSRGQREEINEAIVWRCDRLEERWNASLPDHLVAGWWDGEFCVIPNEEGVIV